MSIEVKDLEVVYQGRKVVNNVSFQVNDDECFGLIGPNGAGKTTIIECVEGIKTNYKNGKITVLDKSPKTHRKEISKLIGIQLQEGNYQDKLKVDEMCRLISSFYTNPADYKELLAEFNLLEHKKKYINRLSGGLKQRLSIVLALIPNPKIVFLDELTTGLDPEARIMIWDYIKKLKEKRISIFMTTHYLEEAERLCDRVGILYNGSMLMIDTPQNIIQSAGISKIINVDVEDFDRIYKEEFEGLSFETEQSKVKISVPDALFHPLISLLASNNITFTIEEPNLEAAYLKIIEGSHSK